MLVTPLLGTPPANMWSGKRNFNLSHNERIAEANRRAWSISLSSPLFRSHPSYVCHRQGVLCYALHNPILSFPTHSTHPHPSMPELEWLRLHTIHMYSKTEWVMLNPFSPPIFPIFLLLLPSLHLPEASWLPNQLHHRSFLLYWHFKFANLTHQHIPHILCAWGKVAYQ